MPHKSRNPLITVYYLIYKLYNSETLWIVKISDILYDLKKSIRYFFSETEQYYIISKKIHFSQTMFDIKQFTILYLDETCKVLFETELI